MKGCKQSMATNEPRLNGFLLDTTALIDFLRGREKVVVLLETLKDKAPLASCPVTVAEVFAGTREKDIERVDQFLSSLVFYPVDYKAARKAGTWRYAYTRQGITLGLTDLLIAAVAWANNLALVTANEKHFPMEELIVIPH